VWDEKEKGFNSQTDLLDPPLAWGGERVEKAES